MAGGIALVLIGSLLIWRLSQPEAVTKQVGSFVLVLEGHPEAANDIDQSTAEAIARRSMVSIDSSNGAGLVQGYRLTSAYHALGLTQARTKDGHSKAAFDHPIDAWVLEFVAPAQQGWAHVSAFAIVNARTGKIESFSEEKNN